MLLSFEYAFWHSAPHDGGEGSLVRLIEELDLSSLALYFPVIQHPQEEVKVVYLH